MDAPKPPIPLSVEELQARLAAKEKRLAEEAREAEVMREALHHMKWLEEHGFMLAPAPAPAPAAPSAPDPVPSPATAAPSTAPSDPPGESFMGRPTWSTVVMAILNREGRGLKHEELLREVEASPVYPQLPQLGRNLYGTVERLKLRGDLKKHMGLLYSVKVLKDLQARGIPLPNKEGRRPFRKSGTFVVAILKDHPEGLPPEELAARIAAMPGAPFKVKGDPRTIYEILEGLEKRKLVVEERGIYRLPEKAKGKSRARRPAPQIATQPSSPDATRQH